jgi:hypothetical protein
VTTSRNTLRLTASCDWYAGSDTSTTNNSSDASSASASVDRNDATRSCGSFLLRRRLADCWAKPLTLMEAPWRSGPVNRASNYLSTGCDPPWPGGFGSGALTLPRVRRASCGSIDVRGL